LLQVQVYFLYRVIIFFNNNLDIIFGLINLLKPFIWEHIFLPILPTKFLDYVCAPMPIICKLYIIIIIIILINVNI
jgi:hypothetical protein